jgi:hypothetical protein
VEWRTKDQSKPGGFAPVNYQIQDTD